MGFWQRLIRLEERVEPIRVAIVSDGSGEQRRLEAAYRADPAFKVVCSVPGEELKKNLEREPVELGEIFAPLEKRAELAELCLESGVNVSVGMPVCGDPAKLDLLKRRSEEKLKLVRVRNHCLYYEPYLKMAELLQAGKIGYPAMLKLVVKRRLAPGNGFDPGKWIYEKESDFLALAHYLCGPLEKVFVLTGKDQPGAGSILVGFKFQARHCFGFLLADFAPQLQIRTSSEPVFRQVWATGNAGVLMANRGEGQLWRTPVLFLRAKDYSHSWENLKDDWLSVYPAMVKDIYDALRKNQPLVSDLGLAENGMRIAASAAQSLREGKEITVQLTTQA